MDAYRKVLQGTWFAIIWLAGLAMAQTTTGRISVDSAPAWNRLFDLHKGWTGGNGSFSIPLSGCKSPDRAAENKTLFAFTDPWCTPATPKPIPASLLKVNGCATADMPGSYIAPRFTPLPSPSSRDSF